MYLGYFRSLSTMTCSRTKPIFAAHARLQQQKLVLDAALGFYAIQGNPFLPVAHLSPSPTDLPPRQRHPVEIPFNAAYHASATTSPPPMVPLLAWTPVDTVSPASSTARSSDSPASCASF
ncbi:hypothetical protein B0H11DRAFT_2291505 [Mycena galericulata]|nr:hypothetical protein B0H11DRAFT_2291505 [Mycena galericulata]